MQTGNSTIFGDSADYASGMAGKTARYLGRPIDPEHDLCVAHRRYPLGSLVHVRLPATGRSAVLVVCDRGPYGRVQADGTWVNGAASYRRCRAKGIYPLKPSCYPKGSRWNGILDVAPAAAKLLEHDGWERAEVRPIRGIIVPRSVLLAAWGGNV